MPLLSAGNHTLMVEGRVSDVVEMQAATQGIAGAWLLEGMEVSVSGGGDGKGAVVADGGVEHALFATVRTLIPILNAHKV